MKNRLSSFIVSTDLKACVASLRPALIAVVLMAAFFGQGDRMVATAMKILPPYFADAAAVTSLIVQPVFLLPACLLLSVAARIRSGGLKLSRLGLFAFSSGGVALIVSLVLKHAIGRARPDVSLNLDPFIVRPFAFDDAYASFPSAQSACAAAVLIGAGMIVPRWQRPLHICAVMLCGARVLTGEHWVSDAVAGWAIGWLSVMALSRLAPSRG
ncbi:phosphatase PAP2 family protein [Rhizobium sp. SL86]|uniref:phosphatase PAP2 family protein n=1 Tax=Rhizobium sp. SL86 TaxID=2995148 RepID=UPI002274276C|nr:phosphatase PAP2 family protein [Rhizobium sp. SL86]MCY1666605.1 phosphatase PAP2 family protein [Rhizobium sp. SL86]